MAVSVQFEIGHTAKLRAKKTPEGFTHDWELYVRGTNKADISAYVDKVVFNLHESFQKPKRVYKEPPYVVHESGYASFVLTVDIYFRNRDEPKHVQYLYDMDIQPHGPPHHRSEEKRFVFENPSDEFRQKLLKGGGVPVVPAGLTGSRSIHSILAPSSFVDSTANVQQPSITVKHKKSGASSGSGESSSSSKKHKSRTEDIKFNSFANLFGPPDPSSKSGSSKTGVETLKNPNSHTNSSTKVLSPNATLGLSSAGASSLKDRPSKDTKDKQSSNSSSEKSKDKSERKEKHKSSSSSSPNKDGRVDSKKSSTSSASNAEAGKSEKPRSEDKPKKDKTRDKDRERSSSGATNSSSGSSKSASSSKVVPITTSAAVSSAPLPRASNHSTVSNSSANRIEEKIANVAVKSDKETKEKHNSSNSSGKRPKKDKKDKDKDREKEKDREKRDDKQRNSGGNQDLKSKEERSHSSASQSISDSPSGQSTSNSSLTPQTQIKGASAPTTTVGNSSNNLNTKKAEKDTKSSESLKTKSIDKPAEKIVSGVATTSAGSDKKSATPNSSNSGSSSTKSHKHKKKDKNKEKDKEKEKERVSTGDKEKDKPKEKHKEKVEEKKEIEKSSEAISNKLIAASTHETKKSGITNPPAATVANSSHSQTPNSQSISLNSNTDESVLSNKKSQNKEKKSKESKSNKDLKRRSETSTPTSSISGELKSKVSKTSTPLSTVGSNIELSDADSRQSAHENIKGALAPLASELHSDSSYSSFPDIPVKSKEKSSSASTTPNISSEKSSKAVASTLGSKENKREKESKTSAKSTEKTSKAEKDEKKRRRNTVTSENTFIEPPVKQSKKEQNKSTTTSRDGTKSPLPSRGNNVVTNAKSGKSLNETNIPTELSDIQTSLTTQSSANSVASTAATSTLSNLNVNSGNAVANHTNCTNANNAITQRNNVNLSGTHPASPALSSNDTLCPNLSELQELHHKIMTLQDNQDLQQIVEMIAASGCYEVTQRTFDFDLCKLDRGTVERLQEFFATSVS